MKVPASVNKFIQEHEVKFIDFRFTGIDGKWHHITHSISSFNNSALEDYITIESSFIKRGKYAKGVPLSLRPDYSTIALDPFTTQNTAIIICTIIDSSNLEDYPLDVRSLAYRAEQYMRQNCKEESALFSISSECYIFDEVSYKTDSSESYYKIKSSENGQKVTPDQLSLGHKIIGNEGYASNSPQDNLFDIRNEISSVMEECGISLASHSHQITGGKCKFNMNKNGLLKAADDFQKYKYVVKNVAASYGKSATFMPRPLYNTSNNSLDIYLPFLNFKGEIFPDNSKEIFSEMTLFYIGGILRHMPVLCAFSRSITNSYAQPQLKENLSNDSFNIFSQTDGFTSIPQISGNPGKGLLFQFPDSAANPYILLPAILMAGLNGVKNKISPPLDMEKKSSLVYRISTQNLPHNLEEALKRLEKEGDFLYMGGVFTPDFIQSYIEMRKEDIAALTLAPHPMEFNMYYSL